MKLVLVLLSIAAGFRPQSAPAGRVPSARSVTIDRARQERDAGAPEHVIDILSTIEKPGSHDLVIELGLAQAFASASSRRDGERATRHLKQFLRLLRDATARPDESHERLVELSLFAIPRTDGSLDRLRAAAEACLGRVEKGEQTETLATLAGPGLDVTDDRVKEQVGALQSGRASRSAESVLAAVAELSWRRPADPVVWLARGEAQASWRAKGAKTFDARRALAALDRFLTLTSEAHLRRRSGDAAELLRSLEASLASYRGRTSPQSLAEVRDEVIGWRRDLEGGKTMFMLSPKKEIETRYNELCRQFGDDTKRTLALMDEAGRGTITPGKPPTADRMKKIKEELARLEARQDPTFKEMESFGAVLIAILKEEEATRAPRR